MWRFKPIRQSFQRRERERERRRKKERADEKMKSQVCCNIGRRAVWIWSMKIIQGDCWKKKKIDGEKTFDNHKISTLVILRFPFFVLQPISITTSTTISPILHLFLRLFLSLSRRLFSYTWRIDNTLRLITEGTGQANGCQGLLVRRRQIVRLGATDKKASYTTNFIINGLGKPLQDAKWRMNWGIICTRRWFPLSHPSCFPLLYPTASSFLRFLFSSVQEHFVNPLQESAGLEIRETKRQNFDF